MNRRGFFGLLGAVVASPKALKVVPAIDIHRADTIAEWFNEGLITNEEAMRLQSVPDTQDFIDFQRARDRFGDYDLTPT